MLFLVVDDDGLSRELLTLLLEAEGHAVDAAASGEAAVTRVAFESAALPDTILADMQMPGLAGAALAAALRAALRGRPALLLAMSGSQPEEAKLAGFDGFLLKPFKISELWSMIPASVLGTSGPPVPARETMEMKTFGSGGASEEPIQCGEPADSKAAGSAMLDAVLDEDIFGKMREMMPAEQLCQMYALCAGDARKRIARMRELAEAGDDAQFRAEAHTVKGGCGMIGARELHELAAVAERDGIKPDEPGPGTSGVTATLTEMSLACDRLERILGERTRE